MKVTINRIKTFATALIILPLFGTILLGSALVPTGSAADDFDAAALYKAKCAMCHGAKVEKNFDASKADDQLVETVLKGKKGEKPPFMPAYETKGIDAVQALALVTHMKQLKGTP
jgi:mono/diheme cytochrome c family protein